LAAKAIEAAPFLLERLKDLFDLVVFGHVARKNDLRADPLRQRPDALLQYFARVGERQLRPLGVERLRDRPGDAPLVRHAENNRPLPLKQLHNPPLHFRSFDFAQDRF
jgi:hypothetical protein